MRFLVYFQLALGVVGAALVAIFAGSSPAASFAGGAGLTLFNLAVLVFGWPRILMQKQVARAVLAIIFKLAISGWILYLVTRSQSVQIGWFALGLATVVPSVLVTAFQNPIESTTET